MEYNVSLKEAKLILHILIGYFIVGFSLGGVISFFDYNDLGYLVFYLGPLVFFLQGVATNAPIIFIQSSLVFLFFTLPYFIYKCWATIFFFILGIVIWLMLPLCLGG